MAILSKLVMAAVATAAMMVMVLVAVSLAIIQGSVVILGKGSIDKSFGLAAVIKDYNKIEMAA